jgi:hypothetical protein
MIRPDDAYLKPFIDSLEKMANFNGEIKLKTGSLAIRIFLNSYLVYFGPQTDVPAAGKRASAETP